MAKTSLVNVEMGHGASLVERIVQEGVPLEAAFWLYHEDFDGYRLMLATPIVDEDGRLAAYQRILPIVRSFDKPLSIEPTDVSVLSPADPFVRNLKRAFSTGGTIGGMRVTRSVAYGDYIEDAYIYLS